MLFNPNIKITTSQEAMLLLEKVMIDEPGGQERIS